MTKIVNLIIEAGKAAKIDEAFLYSLSIKCADNPAHGITIENKYAKKVIGDSAMIASQYIPFLVMSKLSNVIETLRNGNLTKTEVLEFASSTHPHDIIIISNILSLGSSFIEDKFTDEPEPIENLDAVGSNIYGDYGSDNVKSTVSNELMTPVEKLVKILVVNPGALNV